MADKRRQTKSHNAIARNTMRLNVTLTFLLFLLSIQKCQCNVIFGGLRNRLLQALYSSRNVLSVECTECIAAVDVVKLLLGKLEVKCVRALINIGCIELLHETPTFCAGLADEYKDDFTYIFNRLKAAQVCNIVTRKANACGPNPYSNWNVTIPGNKPPAEKLRLPKVGSPMLRVLQFSDLHFDRYYEAGTEADCSQPMCCRASDGPAKKRAAGKWGTVGKCDTPPRVVENMFQNLQHQKFDYILWTGDITPHNIWNEKRKDLLTDLETLSAWIKQYFPNTPVYSAIGNHENIPDHEFPPHWAPEQFSSAWIYDQLAKDWQQYAPNIHDTQTIRWRASYSTKLYPGLRIISLNTEYGDSENYWLAVNQSDPDGTMSWLVQQLTAAEKAGEKVHIIGHIPSGSSMLKQWSSVFYSVVNRSNMLHAYRFSNTVRGQFFGHTHVDEFSVFYENANPKLLATNMVFTCPSVTTMTNLQPAYRIYTVDGNYPNSTWSVLDHETYVMNVDYANSKDKPDWKFEYSAKSAYGMTSLFPEDWNNLIQKFIAEPGLIQKYANYHGRVPTNCDKSCQHNLLCTMRSARADDSANFCKDLPGYSENHAAETLKRKLFSALKISKIDGSIIGNLTKACLFGKSEINVV